MILIIAPSHNRDCRLPGVGQTDNCRLGFTAFVIIRARPGFGRWRGFDKRWCLSHSFRYQRPAFAGRSANDLISARNEPRAVRATSGSADFPSEARRGGRLYCASLIKFQVVFFRPRKYPESIARTARSSRRSYRTAPTKFQEVLLGAQIVPGGYVLATEARISG